PYPHLPHACLSSCPPRAHRSTLFPYTTLFRSHAFAQTRLGQSQRPARRRKTTVLDDGGKKVQVVQILHGAGHGLHGVSVREQSSGILHWIEGSCPIARYAKRPLRGALRIWRREWDCSAHPWASPLRFAPEPACGGPILFLTKLSNQWLRPHHSLRQIHKTPLAGRPAYLAERVGFEPTVGVNPRRFSRP